jgi:hypothetical protein
VERAAAAIKWWQGIGTAKFRCELGVEETAGRMNQRVSSAYIVSCLELGATH